VGKGQGGFPLFPPCPFKPREIGETIMEHLPPTFISPGVVPHNDKGMAIVQFDGKATVCYATSTLLARKVFCNLDCEWREKKFDDLWEELQFNPMVDIILYVDNEKQMREVPINAHWDMVRVEPN